MTSIRVWWISSGEREGVDNLVVKDQGSGQERDNQEGVDEAGVGSSKAIQYLVS